MNTSKNLEQTLHYIDNLHITLTETVRAQNRTTISLIALSIAILALSIGVVSTDKEFSFDGFKLETSFWIIIWGCAWVNAMFYIHALSLDIRQDKLKYKIMELYKTIGFVDEDKKLSMVDSLAIPDITVSANRKYFDSKFTMLFYFLLSIFALIIICLLPIITETFAFYRSLVLIGWTWWGFISILLLLFVSVSYMIVYLKHKVHKNSEIFNLLLTRTDQLQSISL